MMHNTYFIFVLLSSFVNTYAILHNSVTYLADIGKTGSNPDDPYDPEYFFDCFICNHVGSKC